MAAPEIELPAAASLSMSGNRENVINTVRRPDFPEAKEDFVQQDTGYSPSTPTKPHILYHYLTFETELPPPTILGPTIDGSLPPEPPDLRNLVSPFTWSKSRKIFTTWLSCLITVVTAYTAGSYSAASEQMSREWGVSQTAIFVGITTFTTGFATAPMIIAPFSELNGRRPVFIATGILFVISQICCAFTRSYAGMLVARFFAGVGGSSFSTMVGGVVADIYHTRDRNTPMALFSGAALFGTGLGPLCSGFIAQNMSWRWVFYVQTITCGFFILAVILFFKETRGSVLLSRRARTLNSWYESREKVGLVGFEMAIEGQNSHTNQRIRWKVKSDEERESLRKMIGISMYRPFRELAPLCMQILSLTFHRLTIDGARCLLLLSMGRVQLGCFVPNILGDTPCIHCQPWLQYSAKWRSVCW